MRFFSRSELGIIMRGIGILKRGGYWKGLLGQGNKAGFGSGTNRQFMFEPSEGVKDPNLDKRTVLFYRRLLVESTKKLDCPIQRSMFIKELNYLFKQIKEETDEKEKNIFYALCQDSKFF